MEEVINKPDGQFKDILDDLVDYKNQYTSKKNPLIEELDRLKPSIKPAASLNSSLYSSTASSSSSTASDSSASSTSSASSSPSQSQVQANLQHSTVCHEFGRMEELGKTAKILENRLVPSVLNAVPSSSSSSSTAAKPSKINNEAINTACPILSQTIAHKYVSAGSVLSSNSNDISMPTSSTSSSNLINGNSWKTISAKRDKRRKKNEHIIHAGELPGARGIGDPPVEELVMFIESGTNGTSSNTNKNKNNKGKPQTNSSSGSNNKNNHHNHNNNNNSSSNNGNNINNTNTNNKNAQNSTNANNNNNNSNSVMKKNENNHQSSNKPQQISSKMNNTTNNQQHKNPPAQADQQLANSTTTTVTTTPSTTTTAPATAPSIQEKPIKQIAQLVDNNTREPLSNKITSTKSSQQTIPQQKQQRHIPIPQVTASTTTISTSNTSGKQSSQQPRRPNQPSPSRCDPQPASQPVQNKQSKQSLKTQPSENPAAAAVTFANHIKVSDDVVEQYTFGFFDHEQKTSQVQQSNPADNSNLILSSTNSRKQFSHPQQSIQKESVTKQSKASPNSEENSCKKHDNIDANSFNYEQILKFIKNAWENTQSQMIAVTSLNH